ncbi:ABC transporter substrate-binding protein [Pseudoclavibacter endophyticus]|uniref:ABC transporter substrate-binding protein n=2 Tax=Pseudoclavibacter endophyticus TaxID=1778590 RepID=A0A6H9WQU6_9MICO|nr:ABC transporter substrate-binding protein [Pseudoclavibacter endophyticus]
MAAGLLLAVTACAGGGAAGEGPGEAGDPVAGGDLTVLLDAGFSGDWPTGFDPATSNGVGANLGQNAAIFGGLFTLETNDAGEGEIVPNQAESYEFSDDGLVLTIKLREGIEFSDGTPLNAEAVVWNWVRIFSWGSTSAPTIRLDDTRPAPEYSPEFMESLTNALPDDITEEEVNSRLSSIQAVDEYTVDIALTVVNGAFVNTFPTSPLNNIASPAAYAEQGHEQFKLTPVGAGPFTVVNNTLSDRLDLTRNDAYFKEGLPYLDNLSFQAVAGGQVGFQALQAGQGDVFEGLSDTTLIEQAGNTPGFQAVPGPATSPYVIQLNTRQAPFDDKRAREAIYYATNFEAINEGLFGGQAEMSQSFTASGGLFHMPEIEGYRTYDLEKAKALVEELGGLTVELGTTDITTARSVTTALQTQWQEAGIDVTIDAKPLGDVITKFTTGDWESMLQTAGAWDPSAGIGVQVRFGSSSPFSGAPLPEGASSGEEAVQLGLTSELDDLLAASVATIDPEERAAAYEAIATYISDEAYAPFGTAFTPSQIVRDGVHGPGLDEPIPALSVNQGVLYDRVWRAQ